MKKTYLLIAMVILAMSLRGSTYGDSLRALLYQTARTNATLFVSQQAAANTNNLTGTILQSSLDANFDGQGTVSNTLTRILGLDKTSAKAQTTPSSTASSASSTTNSSATETSSGSSRRGSNRHHGHHPQSRRRPPNGYFP